MPLVSIIIFIFVERVYFIDRWFSNEFLNILFLQAVVITLIARHTLSTRVRHTVDTVMGQRQAGCSVSKQ